MKSEYKLQGWVARDECSGEESNLYIGQQKPKRVLNEEPGFGMWCDFGEFMALPTDMFPQLTYKDEPVHVEIIIKAKDDESDDTREQLSPEMEALLNAKTEELNLTVRTLNLLKANGIDTVRDLCRLKRTDWLKFRNGGKKSLTELDDFLTDHSLTWGMIHFNHE